MPDTYIQTTQLNAAGVVISGASSLTAESQAVINGASLPGSQTDGKYDIAFPYERVKSVILLSTVACTIDTNSTIEPDDTIALAANIPLAWDVNSAYPCPFTEDVTAFYVTNVAAGSLRAYVLFDPTE